MVLLFFTGFAAVCPSFQDYNYRDAEYCHYYGGGYLRVAAVEGGVLGWQDRVGDGFVSLSLEDLLPRPDLDQRSNHKASQEGNCLVVPVLEQPGQEMREGKQSGNGSYEVESQARNVQGADALHKVFVLDHQDQEEASRDAGEDHSADAGGAGNQDEPPCVWSFRRGGQRYPNGNSYAEKQAEAGAYVPFLDILYHVPARYQNKPEEESPGCNRMVVKQIEHQFC